MRSQREHIAVVVHYCPYILSQAKPPNFNLCVVVLNKAFLWLSCIYSACVDKAGLDSKVWRLISLKTSVHTEQRKVCASEKNCPARGHFCSANAQTQISKHGAMTSVGLTLSTHVLYSPYSLTSAKHSLNIKSCEM